MHPMSRSVVVVALALCLASALCCTVAGGIGSGSGGAVLQRLKERVTVTAAHAEAEAEVEAEHHLAPEPNSLLAVFTGASSVASAPTAQVLTNFKGFRATSDGTVNAPLIDSLLDTIIETTCTDQHLADLTTQLGKWNTVKKGNQGWPHMIEYQFDHVKDGLTRLRELANALTAFALAGDVNTIASIRKHGTDLMAVLNAFDVIRTGVDATLLANAQPALIAAETAKIALLKQNHVDLEAQLATFKLLDPKAQTYAAEAAKHKYHSFKIQTALNLHTAALAMRVARAGAPLQLVPPAKTKLARVKDYEALNLLTGAAATCRQLVAIATHVSEGLMQAVAVARAHVPQTTCTYRCYRRTLHDKKPRNNPDQACDQSLQGGLDVEDENLWLPSGGNGGLLIMLSNNKLATFINQGLEATILDDDRDASLIPPEMSWTNVWKAGNEFVAAERLKALPVAYDVVAHQAAVMATAIDTAVRNKVTSIKKKNAADPADVVAFTQQMTAALARTRWNTCKAFA